MKTFVAFIVMCALALPMHAEYAKDVISDLTLVYQGSTHRPEWTQEQLTPYVVHKYADGSVDWFFDGFLFYDFTQNWQVGFAAGYGTRNACRADYEWLLDRVFAKDKGIDALDKCIDEYIGIIGKPSFRHKLVLGIPVPVKGQTDWGVLDGETLDFNNLDHRVKACKWYVDQLMSRFASSGIKNVDLVGFYWIQEANANGEKFPELMSEYIHSLEKRFYWIPHWAAPGFTDWKKLGFDMAYLQPNHFFDANILDSRLNDACRMARSNDMGVELEFDHNAFYEIPNSFYSRLESYLDAFERNGAFEKAGIAYYSGTRALLDMSLSQVPQNRQIIDRIAYIVKERCSKASSVEAVGEEMPKIVGGTGFINVMGVQENAVIEIYSVSGACVARNTSFIECPAGIYVVKINDKSQKVVVR